MKLAFWYHNYILQDRDDKITDAEATIEEEGNHDG
jgi:hypothetical protein